MRTMTGVAAFAVFISSATGCAVGQDPPALTNMVFVAAGTFSYGPEVPCGKQSNGSLLFGDDLCNADFIKRLDLAQPEPPARVTLPAFYLDAHEVTNVQYEYCIAMGGCRAGDDDRYTSTNGPNVDGDYFNDPDQAFDNHPVVLVTREEAAEYCAWVGKRLPTEFEWERAAKGGDPGAPRNFPLELAPSTIDECGPLRVLVGACGRTSVDPVAAPVRDENGDYPVIRQATDDYVLEDGVPIYHLFGNVSEWTSSDFTERPTCKESLPAGCMPNHLNEAALVGDGAICAGLCPSQCGAGWLADELQNTNACNDSTNRTSILSADPADATACFYRCKPSTDNATIGSPICVPFSEAVAPEGLSGTPDQNIRVIKGGNLNVSVGDTCLLASWSRNFYTVRGVASRSDKDLTVGFRCAHDGATAPPSTYPILGGGN